MGLIQLPISYFYYHDLHLKSTSAMKLFRLTLSGRYLPLSSVKKWEFLVCMFQPILRRSVNGNVPALVSTCKVSTCLNQQNWRKGQNIQLCLSKLWHRAEISFEPFPVQKLPPGKFVSAHTGLQVMSGKDHDSYFLWGAGLSSCSLKKIIKGPDNLSGVTYR